MGTGYRSCQLVELQTLSEGKGVKKEELEGLKKGNGSGYWVRREVCSEKGMGSK